MAIIDGTPLDDKLIGTPEAGLIRGFGGNDILDGGSGNDSLVGGDGVDTASYRFAATRINVNLATERFISNLRRSKALFAAALLVVPLIGNVSVFRAQAIIPPPCDPSIRPCTPEPTEIQISGQVKDSSGSPISGVTIEVRRNGVLIEKTVTDASGNYLVVKTFSGSVPLGSYTVTPSKPGFNFQPPSTTVPSRGGIANFTGGKSVPPMRHEPPRSDFDGDGRTDFAVFRPKPGETPSNSTWYILRSSDGKPQYQQWGTPGDIPVAGDYDGDGKTDFAVFRPSNTTWYILRSSDGQVQYQQWGLSGDIPVPGDYDGDGRTDIAVFRPKPGETPSNSTWYILRSSDSQVQYQQWGAPGDIPVPAVYVPVP